MMTRATHRERPGLRDCQLPAIRFELKRARVVEERRKPRHCAQRIPDLGAQHERTDEMECIDWKCRADVKSQVRVPSPISSHIEQSVEEWSWHPTEGIVEGGNIEAD